MDMEDNLNFWKIEDDRNYFVIGRRPQFFSKMEDLYFVCKKKTTLFSYGN